MCGPECIDSFTNPLTPSYRPPKGGYVLDRLPDSIATDQLQWAWANRKRRTNNNAAAAITEVVGLLRLNGVEITQSLVTELRNAVTAQWCAAQPERCKKQVSQPKLSRRIESSESAPRITTRKTRRSGGCSSCGGSSIR